MDIKVGQVLEFVYPVNVDGRIIERGTRARVGHILADLMESKLTLVLLGEEKATTIVVDHHVAGIHCRIVAEGT
ncbi:MAG: hypothetical protein OEN48_12820 [Betaproteobacteria bacterium]|nr:hypothetical protein [Gammaproteobacteria bacterium]MDH3437857.1 hypothetical protein [Betaproteobacteria bacterium]